MVEIKTAKATYGVYHYRGDYEKLVDGFECTHCGEVNEFDSDAADLKCIYSGSLSGVVLNCTKCEGESRMPEEC